MFVVYLEINNSNYKKRCVINSMVYNVSTAIAIKQFNYEIYLFLDLFGLSLGVQWD